MRYAAAFSAIGCLFFQAPVAFAQSRGLDALTNSIVTSALAEKEGLTAPIPDGFKLVDQENHGDLTISAYIPAAETAESYTVSVTVYKLNRPIPMSIDDYDRGIVEKSQEFCGNPESKKLATGLEGTLPFTEWLVGCPMNIKINNPEYMVTKSIKGNYSFLAVSYIFEIKPDEAMIDHALAYLKTVASCHPQSDGSGCPRE